MLKKFKIHVRKTIKMTILVIISVFLILGTFVLLYKPTYSVSIAGEHVGYTENKSELQSKINTYIEDGEDENVAFVQVPNLPEYKLCLLKKNIVTNDDEIFQDIKDEGTTYYRYYAIADNGEEKSYVSNFEQAEEVINQLKSKQSNNLNELSIVEKYETEKKDFVEVEAAVASLYKQAPVKTVTSNVKTGGSVDTSTKLGGGKVDIGIALIRPISGVITSRFGVNSRVRSSSHTGLDIGAATGTPIKAAASGTVSFAGRKGSFGNMLAINHGNGVQTYYCHCSALYVSVGQSVSQGEVVAAVGSTGNSTGPHLHLEVRVNGTPYNPQNYVY